MKIRIHPFHTLTSHQITQRDALFGDGFFTTGRLKKGNFLHQSYHFSRLKESAERLQFEKWNPSLLLKTLKTLVHQYEHAVIRIHVYRTQKERSYAFNASSQIECAIFIHQPQTHLPKTGYLSLAQTPISVNPLFAGIKHLNRLDNVLAASECKEMDHEVMMCSGERVISGSRSNLFVYLKGQWITPTLNDCGVKGVIQSVIMQKMKNTFVFKTLLKTDLTQITSAFISNSLMGIRPIRYIEWDSKTHSNNVPFHLLNMDPVLHIKKAIAL
jgi:4-amino-4-deoxychorismate lyase